MGASRSSLCDELATITMDSGKVSGVFSRPPKRIAEIVARCLRSAHHDPGPVIPKNLLGTAKMRFEVVHKRFLERVAITVLGLSTDQFNHLIARRFRFLPFHRTP
jgi:hypothetical protein